MKIASANVLAKIAINKSLLKEYSNSEYSRIVYLRDNSEFQIQIFNPHNYTIGADITIDNKSLGNRLIIKPGERIWLERYFNEARKFLFSTYEVSGTNREVKEAIENNGEIKINFYKEASNPSIYINRGVTYQPLYYNYYNYQYGINDLATTKLYSDCQYTSSLNAASLDKKIKCSCNNNTLGLENFGMTNKTIETGRVEKGGHSNQKFESMNIDFEYWAFRTETIKLLPESQKPIHKEDLQKQYCTNCGRKLNQKYKYCPYCGAKIDSSKNSNNNCDYVLEKCPNCGSTVRSNMKECHICGEILR